jgi:hypothetical protein
VSECGSGVSQMMGDNDVDDDHVSRDAVFSRYEYDVCETFFVVRDIRWSRCRVIAS